MLRIDLSLNFSGCRVAVAFGLLASGCVSPYNTLDGLVAVPLKALTLIHTALVAFVARPASANVYGSPVLSAGINATLTLFKSKSSSALLFLLASASTMTTGISSPEVHSASVGCISTVA